MHENKIFNAEHLTNNGNEVNYNSNSDSDANKYNCGKMSSESFANCYSDSVFDASRWRDCTKLHSYCPITIAESTLQKHEKQIHKRRCKQFANRKKVEHSVYDFRRLRLQHFYFELKSAIDNILKCQLDL